LPVPDTSPVESFAKDLKLVVDAATAGGEIAMKWFGADPQTWKKEGDSPVSEADIAVDDFLRSTLMAARPNYGWLSEETLDDPQSIARDTVFVVDPIDGTRAYLSGIATWCVSVAIVRHGEPIVGVLACPALKEVFVATRGGGAFRDGKRLPRTRTVQDVLRLAGPKPLLARLAGVLDCPVEQRPHVPSLAYRIALVADGRLDGTVVKPNAHDWDLAAAHLILTEAGGLLWNEERQPPRYAGTELKHGTLIAGSPLVVGKLAHAMPQI
jgi:myo-inositol-1(or 4)-monophosphatase